MKMVVFWREFAGEHVVVAWKSLLNAQCGRLNEFSKCNYFPNKVHAWTLMESLNRPVH